MSYDQIMGFGRELTVYLDKDDEDEKGIEELKELWRDIREQRTKQQQHIKQAIQGLIALDQTEKKSDAAIIDLADQGKEKKLKQQISDLTNQLESAEREYEVKKTKLDEHLTDRQKLKAERDRIKNETNISLPKARLINHMPREGIVSTVLKPGENRDRYNAEFECGSSCYDVNLYSLITNIRWRYDCKPNEVVGYMCDKNSVQPFSFDSNQVSDFFTVNYLWDLMEEDW